MKRDCRSGLAGRLLAVLLTLAFAAAGAAHALPRLADRDGGAALTAYLATGGKVADLCGSQPGSAITDEDCPVCHLPVLPPVRAPAALPGTKIVATVVASDDSAGMPAGDRYPAWRVRAPPRV